MGHNPWLVEDFLRDLPADRREMFESKWPIPTFHAVTRGGFVVTCDGMPPQYLNGDEKARDLTRTGHDEWAWSGNLAPRRGYV